MANETLTVDGLAQTIADEVAQRFGLSSLQLSKSFSALIDIKKMLGKIIDPNATVQSDQKLPFVFSKTFKDVVSKLENNENLTSVTSEKSKLEKREELTPVLFAGFTSEGLSQMETHLPEIISGAFEKIKTEQVQKQEKAPIELPGLGIVKGALGVISILGGIFTLLYGLQTDGPFKGLAKLAGKGMLEIGKILTTPLKEFTSTLTKTLINIPLEKIKIFQTFFVSALKKIASPVIFVSKISGKLLAPLTTMLGGFVDNLIAIPMKLFSSFGKTIGGLFDKVAGSSVVKTGLGKITGFLPKMLGAITPILKKIPIIGSLISLSYAVSRFKTGDYIGGGIDILSGIAAMIPGVGTAAAIGLDTLNAFLDLKTGGATGKQSTTKIDILKGMGNWIAEKIVTLPIIGPAIKAAKHFANREWKKGLKQLAFVVPIVDAVAAFLGDADASDAAKTLAGTFKGINWSEIGSWVFDTLKNVPIIGPLMKAIDNFASGNYLKGLKQLAYISPVFEAIGGLLGDKEAGSISTAIGEWGVDLVTDLSNWMVQSLSELINIKSIKDSIGNKIGQVWNWIKGEANSSSSSNTRTEYINPNELGLAEGGIVTQPTKALIGEAGAEAVIPLNKLFNELENKNNNSFAKAETILEKIANNTGYTNQGLGNLINGFNNLAKALKESGTLSQAPVVVNQADQQQSKFAGVAQYAAAMSSPARSYNAGFADVMKPIRV